MLYMCLNNFRERLGPSKPATRHHYPNQSTSSPIPWLYSICKKRTFISSLAKCHYDILLIFYGQFYIFSFKYFLPDFLIFLLTSFSIFILHMTHDEPTCGSVLLSTLRHKIILFYKIILVFSFPFKLDIKFV